MLWFEALPPEENDVRSWEKICAIPGPNAGLSVLMLGRGERTLYLRPLGAWGAVGLGDLDGQGRRVDVLANLIVHRLNRASGT